MSKTTTKVTSKTTTKVTSKTTKRILLLIAYDGTSYAGWQRQDNALAIEEVIESALQKLTNKEIDIIGASRTDAGVHAYGNVAVFDTDSTIPAEKFATALNSFLPEDIRIMASEEVEDDFHPRYSPSEKTYQYHILNTDIPLPTMSRYAHHVYGKLDVDKMRAASSCLIGEHDFTAFCAAGSQVKSKVRTIYEIEITENDLYGDGYDRDICIRITGNGFLYNMVRIIAGTLIEVGQGRKKVSRVAEALAERNRSKAGETAPAKGLFLESIIYSSISKYS